MLPVKPFAQSTGLCGPASLKMVLDFYGIKKSEQALAHLAGSTSAKGTRGEQLVKAAGKLGFKTYLKDFATLADLKKWVTNKKIPVIVDWWSGDDGHYSVVVKIDKKTIYLQDPEVAGIRKMDWITFRRNWFDFEGDYLRKKDHLIVRRMIAVYE